MASPNSEWLNQALGQPKTGRTHWTVVMTTGHFGSDLQLADSSRRFVEELLFEVGSKQDTVEVIGAELAIWYRSKRAPLEELSSLFPLTPAPDSKGGRDLERVVSQLAKDVSGVLVVVSPGASQLAKDGSGKLLGGNLEVAGLENLTRQTIELKTPSGTRNIIALVSHKAGAFSGTEARMPIESSDPQQPASPKPTVESAEALGSPSYLPMFLAGAGVLGLGVLIGRATWMKPKREVLEPAPTVTEPATESDNEDVEVWKSSAKSLQKRFDLIADEMENVASRLESAKDDELVELRGNLHQQQKTLESYDSVAIDFIDGLTRLKELVGEDKARSEMVDTIASQHIRLIQRIGLDTIAPAVGTELIEGSHRVEDYDEVQSDVVSGTISELLSPGFRRGDRIIRQAKVKIWR